MNRRRMGVIGASIAILGCGACSSGQSATSATGSYTPPPTVVVTGTATSTPTPTLAEAGATQESAVSITKCKRDSDGYVELKGVVRNITSSTTDVNMLF